MSSDFISLLVKPAALNKKLLKDAGFTNRDIKSLLTILEDKIEEQKLHRDNFLNMMNLTEKEK
ncbi:MAG: hypothetical protein AAGG81_08640 [Chlamydiota bacterium]